MLAINDAGHRHAYPPQVRFELPENDVDAYLRAADFLNVNTVDVLSVQHEYGIFGGKAGGHLLPLLRALRMPIVSTLHTVLGEPGPDQRRVYMEWCVDCHEKRGADTALLRMSLELIPLLIAECGFRNKNSKAKT